MRSPASFFHASTTMALRGCSDALCSSRRCETLDGQLNVPPIFTLDFHSEQQTDGSCLADGSGGARTEAAAGSAPSRWR